MLDNILVPTAFQVGSQRALTMAGELVRRFGGRVHVLHVIDEDLVEEISAAMLPPPEGATVAPTSSAALAADLGREVEPTPGLDTVASGLVTRAERRMRDFVARLDPGVQVSTEVRIGKPYEAIVEAVAARHVDLVVMGRSRRGLKEYLLGSIADKVVRTVACPVCLV